MNNPDKQINDNSQQNLIDIHELNNVRDYRFKKYRSL